jgi:hypothetical protein
MTNTLAWLFAAPFIALGAWSAWAWLDSAAFMYRWRRPVRLWEDDNQYDPEK